MTTLTRAGLSSSWISNGIFNTRARRLTSSRVTIRSRTFSDFSACEFTQGFVLIGKMLDYILISKSAASYRIKLNSKGLLIWS
jgi:hypothetical protein